MFTTCRGNCKMICVSIWCVSVSRPTRRMLRLVRKFYIYLDRNCSVKHVLKGVLFGKRVNTALFILISFSFKTRIETFFCFYQTMKRQTSKTPSKFLASLCIVFLVNYFECAKSITTKSNMSVKHYRKDGLYVIHNSWA